MTLRHVVFGRNERLVGGEELVGCGGRVQCRTAGDAVPDAVYALARNWPQGTLLPSACVVSASPVEMNRYQV